MNDHSSDFYTSVEDNSFANLSESVIKVARDTQEKPKVSAWFLGPKAENAFIFKELLNEIFDEQVSARRSCYQDDPVLISKELQNSEGFQKATDEMRQTLSSAQKFLKTYMTPYFSPRYQGHMLSECSMPSLLAYFMTMLHNSNNQCHSASTVTTPMEITVGKDFCKMFGFTGSDAFCHLNSGGTLCNMEAAWAHFQAKMFPFSVLKMLVDNKTLNGNELIGKLEVVHCSGRRIPLSKVTHWELLNIPLDETLSLPGKIAELAGLKTAEVWSLASQYLQNSLGWSEMQSLINSNSKRFDPVFIAPATKHFSFPKAAGILGVGARNCIGIPMDARGRICLEKLEERLQRCLETRTPVVFVVGVVGTTAEGAVDPIGEILDLRERFRAQGLEFAIHVDAAWGGYAITAIRTDFEEDDATSAFRNVQNGQPEGQIFRSDDKNIPLSDYVIQHLKRLRDADSITVDPHKWGFVQYGAGCMVYRNKNLRNMTTVTAPVIGGAGTEKFQQISIFGIEGSRPGAAAAAVYVNNRVLELSENGHGQLVCASQVSCKKFYAALLHLSVLQEEYNIICLPPVPAVTAKERWLTLKAVINHQSLSRALRQENSTQFSRYVSKLGPDLNVLCYAFNPNDWWGKPNSDWGTFQKFNESISQKLELYKQVDYDHPEQQKLPRFIVASTTFSRGVHGDRFIDEFVGRIGLDPKTGPNGSIDELITLRSTLMDPYLGRMSADPFRDAMFEEINMLVQEALRDFNMKQL